MCGIVGGAVRQGSVVPFLLAGLKALEYRGYDSSGLAVTLAGRTVRYRALGHVAELESALEQFDSALAQTGIAHTRWATHGAPSERNAHPHISQTSEFHVSVVHNGVIENHAELKDYLLEQGYSFTSCTDTEVIAHLIHSFLSTGATLLHAVRLARSALKGLFAIAITESTQSPGELYALRQDAPLLLGISANGVLLASDASALIGQTNQMVYLENGDIAHITAKSWTIEDAHGVLQERPIVKSNLDPKAVTLGAYRHFMQKEIFEQPRALADTLTGFYTTAELSNLLGPGSGRELAQYTQVLILACGTSAHAALIGRHWIEDFARIPCTVELASEFPCRRPAVRPRTLVITVSQSGETADTKAALDFAQKLGMKNSLSICNVPESSLVRMSEHSLLTKAGPEIGVASTKAFTTQLSAFYLLALCLASKQHQMREVDLQRRLDSIQALPTLLPSIWSIEPLLAQWAAAIAPSHSALFLGRGTLHPIAMEGALKLKEITYIHAEAYSAGELKHGPLALVDEKMPVIVSVSNDAMLEKTKANIQEVLARRGNVYVIADRGCQFAPQTNLSVIELPFDVPTDLAPLAHIIPLQLLAYHTALLLGTNIDKPRNLAKAVTVQ